MTIDPHKAREGGITDAVIWGYFARYFHVPAYMLRRNKRIRKKRTDIKKFRK